MGTKLYTVVFGLFAVLFILGDAAVIAARCGIPFLRGIMFVLTPGDWFVFFFANAAGVMILTHSQIKNAHS